MRTDITNKIDLMCKECGHQWTINPQPQMMPDDEWLIVCCPNCLKTTIKLDWRGATRFPLGWGRGSLVVLPSTFSTEEM